MADRSKIYWCADGWSPCLHENTIWGLENEVERLRAENDLLLNRIECLESDLLWERYH
jgi:hypothetical protein